MPATEKELQKAKQKRKEVDEELVTPPAKVTKVKSESADTLSGPKLSRATQSKPVLEENPGERKVLATAVKAKAAPKVVTIPKLEPSQEDAKTAQAVHDCLRRPSTGDLAISEPSPKDPKQKKLAKEAPPAPEEPDDGDSSDDGSDSEDRRKAKEIQRKKKAHARYMRFSRSLQSS